MKVELWCDGDVGDLGDNGEVGDFGDMGEVGDLVDVIDVVGDVACLGDVTKVDDVTIDWFLVAKSGAFNMDAGFVSNSDVTSFFIMELTTGSRDVSGLFKMADVFVRSSCDPLTREDEI